MTDFVVTITDPVQLAAITWAREQYNASLPPAPPPPEEGGEPGEPPIPPIETDAEYVQWVMEQAVVSYSDQQLRWEHQQNYEDAVRSRSGAT